MKYIQALGIIVKNDNRVPPGECPVCGKYLDGTAGYNTEAKPSPGDVTVCIGCGAINEFDYMLRLSPVPDALCQAPDMADARECQRVIREKLGLPRRSL